MQAGQVVSGREANRLPIGSVIRNRRYSLDPRLTLTKLDDPADAAWGIPGRPGWGIHLDDQWIIVSIASGTV